MENLIGRKFGRLTVKGICGKYRRSALWACLCDCGNSISTVACNLKSGHTKSCGCLKIDVARQRMKRHGHAARLRQSATYRCWASMISRCYNKAKRNYHDYGGRGITVCDRWRNSFENFLSDLGEKPPLLTLDRINNNEGYYPGNVRWATKTEQSRNRRNSIEIVLSGINLCIPEWAIKLQIKEATLYFRYHLGLEPKYILFPFKLNGRKVHHG